MTKKKMILLSTISLVVIFVATIFTVGNIFAASDNAGNIAYIYNVNPLVPTISYETSGNIITISDNNNELKLSKYDLVIVADKLPFNDIEPTKSYLDSSSNYHLVYTNLDAVSNKTLTNSNGATISYIMPLVSEVSYTEDELEKTIIYHNDYVSSSRELKLLDTGRGYNPGRDCYNELVSLANVIYAYNDIDIDEKISLNVPCSLDLLSFSMNLNDDFEIINQYAGSFYIKGNIDSTSHFRLIAPKSNYYFYGTLSLDNEATLVCNFDDYNDLLDDALDFIEDIIPTSIYDNTINLYSHYMLFDVRYSYEISVDGGEYTSIDNLNLMNVLTRVSQTKNIDIKVTAFKGNSSLNRVIHTKLYGTNDESFALAIKDEIINHIGSKQVEQINLLDILKFVGQYFSSSTINFSLNENNYLDAYFVINDVHDYTVNEIDVTKANNVYKIDNISLNSLLIHKGRANLNEVSTFKVTINEISQEGNISFVNSSLEELKSYFISATKSVSTETNYDVYNVRDDGIYLGENKISDNSLNISSIELSVIDNGNSEDIETYFTLNQNETDNSIIESITFNQEIQEINNAYLVYTFNLDDSSSFTYKVQIARVVEGQAGSETTFKSSNPFDDVFSQTDTNWLIGTTFDFNKLTNFPSSYYASIEIISIDDTPYNGSPIMRNETENGVNYSYDISKIVSVRGNSSQTKTIQNKNVYRTLDINIDINYVPARNVKFICKCIAFDDTEVSVEQDYIVTIPGILKCAGDEYANDSKTPYIFKDSDLYAMCVSLFDRIDDTLVDPLINNYKLSENALDHYYILSDAIDYKGELDFTSLTNNYEGEGLDLEGLENLNKISSLNLSNYKIKSLSNYLYADKIDLETLILSSCSLSDNKLFADNNSVSYLYNLDLVNVDFSYNNITRTKDLVYRSVTSLNLSNQTNLSSIDGLNNLVYLENINLANNKIYRFKLLQEMNSLTNVYIYNNVTSKLSSLYGSNGSTNLPVYVWMIKTNPSVKIFAYEENNNLKTNYLRISDEAGTNNISLSTVDACISLNAIVSRTIIYDREDLDLLIPSLNEQVISYRRIGRASQNGINEDNVTSYYYRDGDDYYQCDISSLDDSSRVYYEKVEHSNDYSISFMETDGTLSSTLNSLIDDNFNEDYNLYGTSEDGIYASYLLAYTNEYSSVVAIREFRILLYC